MTRTIPRTLVIPVETLSRELDGKLLLALHAAKRGLRPIIGGRTVINGHLPGLPPSIFLSKGVRVGNRLVLWMAEQLGHIVVALDEESLVRYNDEALYMMYDEATFNRPRILYAWGHDNAKLWQAFPGYRGAPIVESGNPRADMLRKEYRGFYAPDAAKLKERFGRYVLFSSNFSFVNHYIPDFVRFRVTGDAPAERSGELLTGIKAHKKRIYDAFLALIPELARAVSPAALIVRPHPSENPETWKMAASGLDNVHVVHEGPIAPWLMAAAALIQNGCTSAVEAALLGVPAISYRPVRDAEFDPTLPFAVSVEAATPEAAIAAVGRCLSGTRSTPDDAIDVLRDYIASVDGPLACERILNSFDSHRTALETAPAPSAWRHGLGLAVNAQRAVRRFVRAKSKGKSSAAYTAHKFPGLAESDLTWRIARFHEVDPTLPALRPRKLRDDVFVLEG